MTHHSHPLIQAIVVNHNTSKFTELMLRSLFDKHASALDMSVTVIDNASTDDTSNLLAYLESKALPLHQSGFTTETESNSHGEVLGRFVLDHPHCEYYLFLDADISFLEEQTIDAMLTLLRADDELFGVGARQSWDGQAEIPAEIHEAIYYRRLHPCCALVKNSPPFRRIVTEVGLSGLTYHRVEGEEYWDTFELMTKVIRTHGLRHAICAKLVYHFFSVSYDPRYMDSKHKRCDELLAALR